MIIRDEKGNVRGDAIITREYNNSAKEAETALKDIVSQENKQSLTDSEITAGSRAIAGFQTGAFTINDANALNYTNTSVREAFEKVTGVNLDQYIVKKRNGETDISATNAATKDALFAMAADNYIQSARAETENFNDIVKGQTKTEVKGRLGSNGDIAMTSALKTVDPADEANYDLMTAAAQNVYEHGRYTEESWDSVRDTLSETYPSLSQEALKEVYDAAKQDKAVAENPYHNAIITQGDGVNQVDMSEAGMASYGKFENLSGNDIGMKEQAVLESIANEFGINVRLMPSETFKYKYKDKNGKEKTAYSNGQYDSKTGTMLLNAGNDMERNIVAVALHEITHHIALYAPDEYLALSNRVMETWYNNDADAFKAAIQRKQDAYETQVNQKLSEEQALEEVIADAIGEMSSDQSFIDQICAEEPNLARQIINAIKEVLRKLRAVLASGDVAEEYEDAFFNQLGMWSEVESLWLNAAKVAQQNRANAAIDALQNQIIEESRLSANEESTSDADYMAAVERGDMETAQRMVEQAARDAGYYAEGWHQTKGGFTEFKTDNPQAALNDSETPNGIFFKTNDHDIGLEGKNQMHVFINPGRMLSFENRDEANKWYKDHVGSYATLDAEMRSEVGKIDDKMEALEELMFGDGVTDEEYDALNAEWDDLLAEMKPVEDSYRGRLRDLLNNYFLGDNREYDSIHLGYDGHRWVDGKREDVETYIVFDSNQAKLADPVTYDDDGNVIPLSERFKTESPDIRYSVSEEQAQEIHEAVSPMIRFSTPTERDVLPKARYTAAMGFSNAAKAMSGRAARINALVKNGFSEEQAKQIGDAVSDVILDTGKWIEDDLQHEFTFIGWDDLINAEVKVRKDWKGKVVGVSVSAMVANGEYPVNFDLTTICNKREGIMQVIQELTRIKTNTGKSVLDSVKLTDEDMWNINKALKAEGIDTACLGCFVEARRYYTNRFIASIDNKWNTAVRETRRQLGLPEEEYFDFAHGKKVTGEDYTAISDLWTSYEKSKDTKKSPEQRIRILMNEIIKNNEVDSPYLKLVSASDILTPEGIEGLKQISTGKHDLVKTLKSIYGTSAPKEILAFTPYNSEIALLPARLKGQKADKYLRSIGGIRIQSFSDFKIEHVIDHMQMVADMAARKFTCHAYSKVIAFPRIFGLTGQKINMSVMFDITPAEKWSNILGCSEEKATEYAYKYAGLRFVKEKPSDNPDNRPYIETEIEGVHGYLTYLLGDADYINSVYEAEYQKNIDAGMDENEARRKANEAKPFEQSINYREAVELENQDGYKENVGIIAVAYGDEHLKILLADPNVRYVIPYHKSGLPVFVSQKTSLQYARNYEPVQNTKKADPKEKLAERFEEFKKNSKDEYPAIAFFKYLYDNGGSIATTEATATEAAKLHGTGEFDVYKDLGKAKDIKEVSNAYLEDCIKNNLVPVFSEFAGDPNYYKMLFDFAVTDGTSDHIYPQKTVRNNYPGIDVDAKIAAGKKITDKDYSKLREVIRMGAEEQNTKNERRAKGMDTVLDDILSKDSENSILAGTNVNAIRDSSTDYTDPKGIKYSITPEMDEEYMAAVKSGNMEEAQRLVDEAAKMAMPDTKLGGLWMHGTNNEFTEFNFSQGGKNGRAEGYGIYLTQNQEIAQSYGNRIIKGYVNITRPAFSDKKTIKKSELKKLIKTTIEDQAKRMVVEDSYADIASALRDTWISDYTYTYDKSIDASISAVADQLLRINDNDMDIIQEVMLDTGVRTYSDATNFYDTLTALIGFDGFSTVWDNVGTGEQNRITLAFRSNQIKSADPVTYAEDGSVIPLSERFDPSNNDIRYSLPTQDSDGNILSDGQMEYFKNSQARDAEGKMQVVYHTTNHGGFTVFDPSYSDDKRSLFFASNFDVSQTYGSRANKPIEFMSAEDQELADEFPFIAGEELLEKQHGFYQVYLNLENPLIINAEGQTWNNIPYGEYSEDAVLAIKNLTVQDMGDGIYVNIWGDRKIDGEWQDFRESDVIEYILDHDEIPNEAWDRVYDFMLAQGLSEKEAERYSDASFFDFNGLDTYDKDGRKVESDVRRYRTRELAELADNRGHDGVIIRNCRDIGTASELKGDELSDIFIAFSSEQIKDTRNTDPTNNPDIRYSIVDDDEAMSKMAHDYAYDTSHEALEYYESLIDDLTDKETDRAYHKAQKFVEKNVDKFYAGLEWYSDGMKFDDVVLEEGRERMASSKADFMNRADARWNESWYTEGRILNTKSVKTPVRKLVMSIMRHSDTTSKYKTELVNKTIVNVRLAYFYAQQGRTEIADAILWHSALNMIEDVDFIDDSTFRSYKDLRDYLRTTKISLNEEYWSDVDYQAFRKNNFGRINLVSGKTNVDQIYQEMCELWPEWFKEDEDMTPPDQLARIEQVLEAIQPYKIAYSSEEASEMAFDIASDLFDIMQQGEEYKSVADKFKEKYDSKTKALKQKQAEDYKSKIDKYKEKYDRKTKALKQRHAEAMRTAKANIRKAEKDKAKAKFKEYKEKQREKKFHSKYFESIQKTHAELVKRLTTNTKDKHIPEQYKRELASLLAAFDFQTVRSKNMELKKGADGYVRLDVSKKTIELLKVQATLKAMETKSQFFHVNDSITEIMDQLLGIDEGSYNESMNVEGKTIDELNAEQLKKIDKMLKSLLHEFNNYENVRVGIKKQKAEDLGGAQIESSLAHAEKFGSGKDYNNFFGALDRIINLDEVTPAYLMKQIDPNNDGIGVMYKELRRSFDKYIRNQEQLNTWMEEIVGEYHNKGIAWKKYGSGALADWRSINHAKTFQLSNGKTIELTPAQMMSIHCLAKRPQAYNHMVGAGIVVKPVSFQAKLMSDLKHKANYALPVQLTDADIRLIESRLTPDQIKVADKLQELMATKMAAWGNEASMSVIGINLFEDPNYFPIKSDRAALEKDFTADQFTDMIRNFGFTKAVAPKARNAIAVDDIFDVVTEHCNNMNLYNAYTESLNDFMKVYNYHQIGADGSDYSVEQAISYGYSQKATTFIRTFIQDLNGNVSKGRTTGLNDMMNDALGKAKKASVFANGRVALQQPTAIVRAFAVISPKYMKDIKPSKAAMKEMFEHCPIALWKSWGYYDINMGKSIEDLMMNNGSWVEDKMTDVYGKLDNATWSMIWQMVKAEVKDNNPNIKEGSDEFFDLCNERMTEVVDLTQVVDSPFHRSHAMRDKQILTKMFTAFMAEPTLTFNMLRDGYNSAREAFKSGDKAKAARILGRTSSVFVLQAATVAGAAAIWDALRGKNPDKDDEDENALDLWWENAIENFKDNINLLNNVYYVKDVASIFQGWDQRNLGLQGYKHLADAWGQLTGSHKVSSQMSWYENALAGLGYLTGIPFKTMQKDGKAILNLLGVHPQILSDMDDYLMAFQDVFGGEASASGVSSASGDKDKSKKEKKKKSDGDDSVTEARLWTYEDSPIKFKDGSIADNFLNSLGINLTASEREAIKLREEQKEMSKKVEDIKSKTESLTGEEKDKKVWQYVSTYLKSQNEDKSVKEFVESGDYTTIDRYRNMYEAAGGNTDYFDERIFATSKSAMKKTIISDPTAEQIEQQSHIKNYLLSHGMSESELSEIAYKSYTARDLKVAFRINDEDAAVAELVPLIRAGLTQEDYEKLWENRNKIDIEKYKADGGKYADRLKSTGVYNWPINGQITSRFGHRSSPGGVGSTNHQGLDIAGNMGDPVGASDGGTVVYAGWYGGAGKTVMIEHDDGTITQYSHLSWYEAKEGDIVAQGQTIGNVGSTGNSTGPHLHFAVKVNGTYQDPLEYLAS